MKSQMQAPLNPPYLLDLIGARNHLVQRLAQVSDKSYVNRLAQQYKSHEDQQRAILAQLYEPPNKESFEQITKSIQQMTAEILTLCEQSNLHIKFLKKTQDDIEWEEIQLSTPIDELANDNSIESNPRLHLALMKVKKKEYNRPFEEFLSKP